MQLFLRLIALLLVLTTGGVFQTLSFVSAEEVACAGEEDEGTCTDCAFDCGMCLCCPLRAVPSSRVAEAPVSAPELPPVPSTVDEPMLSGLGADIFQPPIA